jgi:hypothetical protein
VIERVAPHGIPAKEMDVLLQAIGWRSLVELGPAYRMQRFRLLEWACRALAAIPRGDTRDRLRQLALQMPLILPGDFTHIAGAAG